MQSYLQFFQLQTEGHAAGDSDINDAVFNFSDATLVTADGRLLGATTVRHFTSELFSDWRRSIEKILVSLARWQKLLHYELADEPQRNSLKDATVAYLDGRMLEHMRFAIDDDSKKCSESECENQVTEPSDSVVELCTFNESGEVPESSSFYRGNILIYGQQNDDVSWLYKRQVYDEVHRDGEHEWGDGRFDSAFKQIRESSIGVKETMMQKTESAYFSLSACAATRNESKQIGLLKREDKVFTIKSIFMDSFVQVETDLYISPLRFRQCSGMCWY